MPPLPTKPNSRKNDSTRVQWSSHPQKASRLGLLALVTACVIPIAGLTGAQEAPPADIPLPGRIIRWIDLNPAGAVDHWEWRIVSVPEDTWSPIHGVTQIELNGLWYGIAFPPPGVFDIEIRAIAATGETTVIASAPSNPIRIPGCSDADLNRDGVVGGPDYAQFAFQFNQTCTGTN